ncbi:fungal specific transcription factor domain-containing protein [Colletotrichum nymphaeae SA-01]|uniref:Fungal specific transcription factor domain-containing protein n=1 Tax=Colletotrichum nymphaeae SA-01 TaxID=1460502 RepID=A0A135TRW5_9PEZI|nr:fungal specific transcription factor domain-containing protein [Colletotrichum nymphaeae SA-01]
MPTAKVPPSERQRCVKACGNCKARKERCDGQQPCGRCVSRKLQAGCSYARVVAQRRLSRRFEESSSHLSPFHSETPSPSRLQPPQGPITSTLGAVDPLTSADGRSPHHPRAQPRLPVQDADLNLTFCRDSSLLTLLQNVRLLAGKTLGSCTLVDTPRQPPSEPGLSDSSAAISNEPPAKPTVAEASDLSTDTLQTTVSEWLQMSHDNADSTDAPCYLILALGAQLCPEDKDEFSQNYFRYGRLLAVTQFLDTYTISSIRCYLYITMYLLNASKPDSASKYLAMAAGAAYSLGIHRTDVPSDLSNEEVDERERLWKALRKLDLFISSSYGRPISTYETRHLQSEKTCTPVVDLGVICESILLNVYLRRNPSEKFIQHITEQHRSWVSRLSSELEVDGIAFTKHPQGIQHLTLSYVNGSYYLGIMLLTRPFFLDYVSAYVQRSNFNQLTKCDGRAPMEEPSANAAFIQAGVDAAIQTIKLFQAIFAQGQKPKRLPFVVGLVFAAALTLCVALFADLDRVFSIDENLLHCQHLLDRFRDHDAHAGYYAAVVEDLRQTKDQYIERRRAHQMLSLDNVVSEAFGRIPGVSSGPTSTISPSLEAQPRQRSRPSEEGPALEQTIGMLAAARSQHHNEERSEIVPPTELHSPSWMTMLDDIFEVGDVPEPAQLNFDDFSMQFTM